MIKYEATNSYMTDKDYSTYRQVSKEFDTIEEAKLFVETDKTAICGKVITWSVHPNLPNCLPAMRYSSCALITYENGEWKEYYIHG